MHFESGHWDSLTDEPVRWHRKHICEQQSSIGSIWDQGEIAIEWNGRGHNGWAAGGTDFIEDGFGFLDQFEPDFCAPGHARNFSDNNAHAAYAHAPQKHPLTPENIYNEPQAVEQIEKPIYDQAPTHAQDTQFPSDRISIHPISHPSCDKSSSNVVSCASSRKRSIHSGSHSSLSPRHHPLGNPGGGPSGTKQVCGDINGEKYVFVDHIGDGKCEQNKRHKSAINANAFGEGFNEGESGNEVQRQEDTVRCSEVLYEQLHSRSFTRESLSSTHEPFGTEKEAGAAAYLQLPLAVPEGSISGCSSRGESMETACKEGGEEDRDWGTILGRDFDKSSGFMKLREYGREIMQERLPKVLSNVGDAGDRSCRWDSVDQGGLGSSGQYAGSQNDIDFDKRAEDCMKFASMLEKVPDLANLPNVIEIMADMTGEPKEIPNTVSRGRPSRFEPLPAYLKKIISSHKKHQFTESEKKLLQRYKNRESARAHRKRQRTKIETMRRAIQFVQRENSVFRYQVGVLSEKIRQLQAKRNGP